MTGDQPVFLMKEREVKTMEKFFLHQIKRTNGTIEKGIVVKDSYEDALQGYHAYLGAYGYNHDANTDYVQCSITGSASANPLISETWIKPAAE